MTSPSVETQSAWDTDEPTAQQKISPFRDTILALSIAHLTFIHAANGLLFELYYGYFNRVPVNRASLAALLLNIFGLAVVLWGVGRLVRRTNHRVLSSLACLAVCAIALIPLNFARTHYSNLGAAKLVALLKEPLIMIAAILVVLLALWFHRRTAKLVMVIYLILSPMVLFTVGKTVWRLIRPPPALQDAVAPVSRPALTSPQIVWMLLDELDQRVAFEAHPPDIAIPELTRFYNDCFHATNAFPPGGATIYSLPALTIGRPARGADAVSASELVFNGKVRWSETDTVFSRARSLGFSTAVVGWLHPYSRVLGKQLDRCEWYPYPPYEGERGKTVGEATVNQLCSVFSQFQQRRLHLRNATAAHATAERFLTDSPAALTLVHLPIPHPPGIYDARKGRFTLWKYSVAREYLENLALVDRQFGTLRRAMEQNGTWDKAWVILSSDHWWRESAQYDGKTDHRVPFIIKAPGQNQSAIYDKKFDTAVTYHLILSILKGELKSAPELSEWLDNYRTDPPSSYSHRGEPR